jgi:hypothetical protein
MIIEHNGKRIAFGVNWKSRLSEGNVHSDARAARSKFFWHGDKAVYFGTLPEDEIKKKQKSPLYAGAVALQHRYSDVPNLVMVLAVPTESNGYPDGGYIVCGIHQGRPRSGFDKVVRTEVEVSEMLKAFQDMCGHAVFELYGDVKISGIKAASLDDVFKGADQGALMRKTKSAFVNPLAVATVGIIVTGAVISGYSEYSKYKRIEAQRIALAAQKNSQQLYDEELVDRRHDGAVLAKSISTLMAPLRAMDFGLGGWPLGKATCILPVEKMMKCSLEYQRPEGSRATYETFLAAAKQQFDNVEFAGGTIKAAKAFASMPFTEQGKAIEAAKTQRDAMIEFGSTLQRLERLGKQKRDEFQPFGIPPGANPSELTTPPITSANWEITTPFRNMKELAAFPDYATIAQIEVIYTDKPAYEPAMSLAMVKVTGKIFSKPN